jgi:hypothetical protein
VDINRNMIYLDEIYVILDSIMNVCSRVKSAVCKAEDDIIFNKTKNLDTKSLSCFIEKTSIQMDCLNHELQTNSREYYNANCQS